jgi:hypothetical protein
MSAWVNTEWEIWDNYLEGDKVAGVKLKETGTAHWLSPNTVATNETGFTTLTGDYSTSSYLFTKILVLQVMVEWYRIYEL